MDMVEMVGRDDIVQCMLVDGYGRINESTPNGDEMRNIGMIMRQQHDGEWDKRRKYEA